MRREKNLATSSSYACFFDKMSLEFGFWLIALHAKIFLSHFLFSLVLVVFSIETDPFPVLPVKVSCVLSVSTKKNIKYTIHKSSWKRKKIVQKIKGLGDSCKKWRLQHFIVDVSSRVTKVRPDDIYGRTVKWPTSLIRPFIIYKWTKLSTFLLVIWFILRPCRTYRAKYSVYLAHAQ